MKNLYFIFCLLFFTSNECFSHFSVQQLLSYLRHFALFSQAHLKITLKTKTFEKIYFIRFYGISNTTVRFTLFKIFGARFENPKINKQGGPNKSVGLGFFFQKSGVGAFIRDLRVAFRISSTEHSWMSRYR